MTDYTLVERRTSIPAPAEQITPWIVDYRRWVDWSPWEGLDPDLKRTYDGPEAGVGSSYEWSGNRKAGAGRMEITSVADGEVAMDLEFTRPFKSSSKVRFALVPSGDGTDVVWQLRSPKTFISRVVGLFMNMDKTIGADLDKGLVSLRAVVQSA